MAKAKRISADLPQSEKDRAWLYQFTAEFIVKELIAELEKAEVSKKEQKQFLEMLLSLPEYKDCK